METLQSKEAQFREYDPYEVCDIGLSRLIVEAYLTPAMQERLLIRYGHFSNFEMLPGSVLFMMVLQICNASADQDISAAKKAFKALTLASYPGENVDELATEALRLIKIMQGGYALEYSLGTQLLTKVTETSC